MRWLALFLFACLTVSASADDGMLLGAGRVAAASCSFTRIDFTTGSLGTASLSRASSATYINSGGVLSTATTNAARFNYDANYPAGNAAPSLTGPFLLVEPAATNLLFQSNAFSTGPWFATSSATLVSGSFTSPDNTADGWTLTSGTGFGGIAQNLTLSAVPYAMSVWSKSGTASSLEFYINGSTTVTALSASIKRLSYSTTPTGGSGVVNEFVVFTGTAAQTVGIFGSQFETGSVSTSYIVTTTGSASRSADVVTFTQPSSCGHNTYTFDNNTTQVVSQAAGTATVPTNLNRPNIKFIDGST